MPIYEYQCSVCSTIFEELVSSVDKISTPCIRCGQEAHRVISKTTFQLKGDGWYVTEYGNKSQSSNNDSGSSASGSASNTD